MPNRTSRPSPVLVSPRPVLRTPAVPTRPAPVRPTAPAPAGAGDRVKAAADVVLAAALLVPALPLMLLCVAVVRLTSAGPAIYTQTRVGRGGRVFTLYKIR